MERGQFGGWNQEDEDDEDEFKTQESGKSFIIFLIDCTESMNEAQPNSTNSISPFQATLQCLINYYTKKVKKGDGDEIGVVLFGSKHSKSINSSANIHSFLTIDKPDIDQILKLQSILDARCFESTIGTSTRFSIFDALIECAYYLKKTPKKFKRFLYIITNNDDPCRADVPAFSKALLKSQDLVPVPISMEVFGVERAGVFNYDKFWRKLTYFTYNDEDEQEFTPLSIENDYRAIDNIFRTKEFSRRNAFSIPFVIGGSLVIGVKGFNQIMEMKKSSYVYVERKSGLPVSSKAIYISETTGRLLTEWNFYYMFGGDKIKFTKDEVRDMRSGGPPGLKLLGFRDMEELKSKFNLKHSIFMIPDDTRVKGSSSFFAHFLERVHSRDKFVICSLVSRNGSQARLVALIPQMASYDEKRGFEVAAGFNMIILPFADDIRSIDCPILDVEQSYVDSASAVIESAMNLSIEIENISNPVLDRHFSAIRKIALEEEAEDDFFDMTKPDHDKIFEASATMIKSFNDLVISNVTDDPVAVVEKRPVSKTKDVDQTTAKKAKGDNPTLEEVKSSIAAGTLKKMTVATLTSFLSMQGERIASKKKADLLEQVEAFIRKT